MALLSAYLHNRLVDLPPSQDTYSIDLTCSRDGMQSVNGSEEVEKHRSGVYWHATKLWSNTGLSKNTIHYTLYHTKIIRYEWDVWSVCRWNSRRLVKGGILVEIPGSILMWDPESQLHKYWYPQHGEYNFFLEVSNDELNLH